MNIKQLFVAFISVVAFVACSSDDMQEAQNSERYPIRLTNNLTGLRADVTRASGSYADGFTAGNVFWVWADMTDEGESNPLYQVKEYISSWNLTVSSMDASTFDAVTTHTFPVYNKLSFYAMHGNFTSTLTAEATSFPSLLTHIVKSDQKSDNDFQASDLVYAIKPDVAPQADVVPLHFYHLLSKVEVALKAGNRVNATDLTQGETEVTVTLVGTKTRVQFRPSKSVASTINTEAGRLSMLTAVDETVQPITMSTVTTDNFNNGTCASAIVVPQTVNGHFVCLSYQNHTTYFDVTNLELKSGYRYRFNLTVDRIGDSFIVTPNLTITPWEDEVVKSADLDTLTGSSNISN